MSEQTKGSSNNTTPAKSDNNQAINLSTPSRKVGDNANANSCLSGQNNPKTLRRTKEGKIQVVHFGVLTGNQLKGLSTAIGTRLA